ncbi:hypothetical protein AaE_001421, partial [Aphanomyces astaci]
MQFMAEHGFDFNKFIRDGIPYLSRKSELSVRRSHEKSIANLGKSPPEKITVGRHFDKLFLTETVERIDTWLADSASADASSPAELFISARNS